MFMFACQLIWGDDRKNIYLCGHTSEEEKMLIESLLVGTAIAVPTIYVVFSRRLKRATNRCQELEKQLGQALQSQSTAPTEGRYSQEEMERLSIVAQQTDNAIMIMDAHGNIEWINDGFTRMYEYTFDEFIRKRGDNILKTSFNPAIRERLERCIRTKQPVYYEAINVTPSGKELWTHTSLTPILDEQGNVIHLATIDSDISKRKEAGDALVQRVNALSLRIGELVQQQQRLVDVTQELMQEAARSTKRINETDQIVRFIREMSDRIRIMGLNASIEAHSAGALGNGFRVISGEIVKMSDETKKHAQQIFAIVQSIKEGSEMLGGRQSEVEKTAASYMKAIDALKSEVMLVERVAERLN
jgi:PAS domain S-box-containing protein